MFQFYYLPTNSFFTYVYVPILRLSVVVQRDINYIVSLSLEVFICGEKLFDTLVKRSRHVSAFKFRILFILFMYHPKIRVTSIT